MQNIARYDSGQKAWTFEEAPVYRRVYFGEDGSVTWIELTINDVEPVG